MAPAATTTCVTVTRDDRELCGERICVDVTPGLAKVTNWSGFRCSTVAVWQAKSSGASFDSDDVCLDLAVDRAGSEPFGDRCRRDISCFGEAGLVARLDLVA